MRSRVRNGGARVLVLAALAVAGGTPDAAGAAAPTRARAGAFARAVNLVAADLPGYASAKSRTTAGEKRFGASVARCAGGVDGGEVLSADSPDFSQASPGGLAELDANSTVSVARSSGIAAKDLAVVRSSRGKACLVAAVDQLLKSMKVAGVSFGRATVTTTRPPAPGANGSFELRLRITANAGGVRIPFYLHTLGFRLGPAAVALSTLGILTPFPAADEQRLFAVLLARARANRL
ncbi:MAG: hypothetical protein QOF77_1877 [Solirubrobacteraceae bacterium]|nr:hypothetical protein [Solirubrobacteraceae bacterium]